MQGWLLLNKPSGITSSNALSKIKHFIKPYKVGHSGTLDPFATGMLLVGIGKATKLMQYAIKKDKVYQFTIKFGENTDTLDLTGNIVETSPMTPTRQDIENTLPEFHGKIMQTPPIYSAIKIKGMRACDRVRRGEIVQLSARLVTCYDLQLLAFKGNQAKFHVKCSSGFYIRSLAYDIVKKLGVCGHVSQLHRNKINNFVEKDFFSLDYIEKIIHNKTQAALEQILLPVDSVLDDILVLEVSRFDCLKLQHGQKIYFTKQEQLLYDELYLVKCDGKAFGLCSLKANILSPKLILI